MNPGDDRATHRIVFWVLWMIFPVRLVGDERPHPPRIEWVEMLVPQPHQHDPAVVWYDDFDEDQRQSQYAEKEGDTTSKQHYGSLGKSLPMYYPKGQRGIGGRKVFFGDSPTHAAKTVRRGESFTDIYWRIYVKHQPGWTGGGPAKLSRATSLVPPGWRQAMIAHVWSSGEALTLDPATGVRGDRVVTTRYNDFSNLKWLGNNPASKFPLHSVEESGWWVCVEARAKLNTPGKSDGVNQLWIDGRLEAERQNLNWRGNYTAQGINAVFLESYWNQGSPVDQSRWIDNFVISTKPIGPIVSPRTPMVTKTAYQGAGQQQSWEFEVSADSQGESVVWKSKLLSESNSVRVGSETGQFLGELAGQTQLATDTLYFLRTRQQNDAGRWSEWSRWHQPFQTP